MAIVCVLIGVVTGWIAIRSDDKFFRRIMLVIAALNFAAAGEMVLTGYEYAYKFKPNPLNESTSRLR